ncbi:SDR family oxidoreductase [Enterobacteriaceae bacterium LUAb1]
MQKYVLITGCSSGIGLIAAQDLHSRGYHVLAACRKAEDVRRMECLGYTGLLLDMSDSHSVNQAAEKVLELCNNRLYGLFNNAGYGVYGPLSTLTRQHIEQQFATNVFGIHQLTMLLLPAMLAHNEGRIICTSSVMGLVSTPGRGAYAASKFALEAWSDTLRMELQGTRIYVSLIEPGPLTTRFSDNVMQTQHDKPVKNPGIADRFALPAEAVLPKLRHALESRHPHLRYPVTLIAYALILLKKVLPVRLMDILLRGHRHQQ